MAPPRGTEASTEAIRQQALEWLVTLWSRQAGAAEQDGLAQWRARSAEHERAWQQVLQLDRKLSGLPGTVAATALREAQVSRGRRRALRSLGVLAAAGGAAWALLGSEAGRRQLADLRTSTGQRRAFVLADGSRVNLNTASAVDVRFDAGARRLRLLGGEIFVATAPDPAGRPFFVETPVGTVQALGTQFDVRLTAAGMTAAVLEAMVELRVPGVAPVRLAAGQQADCATDAIAAPRPVAASATAWLDGVLVAERMRLGDFLAELDRYRPGVIRCDPAVAGLVVSGVYPLDDTDRILQSLAQALPVRIARLSRYWVTVAPR